MERKELEELAIYCNRHYCKECEFCEDCDEIDDKIDIAELTSGNAPCYWSDEDIDYILDEINKKNEDTSK